MRYTIEPFDANKPGSFREFMRISKIAKSSDPEEVFGLVEEILEKHAKFEESDGDISEILEQLSFVEAMQIIETFLQGAENFPQKIQTT